MRGRVGRSGPWGLQGGIVADFTRPLGVLLAAMILVAGLVGWAEAGPPEYLPVGHWVYAALRQLAAAGLIGFDQVAQLPLTREEVGVLLATAQRNAARHALSPGLQDLLTALRAEVPQPLEQGRRSRIGVRVTTGAEARTLHPARSGSSARIGSGLGEGRWFVWGEVGIEEGALTVPRTYLAARVGTVHLQAGREPLFWGPSLRTSLFLAGQPGDPGLLRFSVGFPRLRFSKFGARLTADPTRYLIGTRVDWQLSDRLRVGLAELAVARPSPLLTYWILNPLPVLLTNALDVVQLQERAGANDNALGGVDVDFLLSPGRHLYGQLLIDDLSAAFPNRVGALLGLYLEDPFRTGRTSLRLEYSAVANWTYTDMSGLGNHYARNGRPLGYWLGNDADDLYLEINHVVSAQVAWTAWVSRTRHGEGRIGRSWTSPEKAWRNWWLSGVVETRYAAGLQYASRQAGRETTFWAEVGYLVNRGNVPGASGPDLRAGFHFSVGW